MLYRGLIYFFCYATSPSAIYTLSLHDALPIYLGLPGLDGFDVTRRLRRDSAVPIIMLTARDDEADTLVGLELGRSEEHTSELQSRFDLVCRLLLEKKKNYHNDG